MAIAAVKHTTFEYVVVIKFGCLAFREKDGCEIPKASSKNTNANTKANNP